jgi:hypothetical protein
MWYKFREDIRGIDIIPIVIIPIAHTVDKSRITPENSEMGCC